MTASTEPRFIDAALERERFATDKGPTRAGRSYARRTREGAQPRLVQKALASGAD